MHAQTVLALKVALMIANARFDMGQQLMGLMAFSKLHQSVQQVIIFSRKKRLKNTLEQFVTDFYDGEQFPDTFYHDDWYWYGSAYRYAQLYGPPDVYPYTGLSSLAWGPNPGTNLSLDVRIKNSQKITLFLDDVWSHC